MLASSCLQVVGFALLSTLPVSLDISRAQYGYQVLAGLGCGANVSLLIVLAPFCVETRDHAVAMGAVPQFRFMGGAIGLSIVNTVMQSHLRSRLAPLLTTSELRGVLRSAQRIAELRPGLQEEVVLQFAEGYNTQMKILAGLAAIQIIGVAVMWQKKQIRV